MAFILDSLNDFCEQYACERNYWIAFSGGLDSTVLLHALIELRKQFPLKLKAIHVNHGLSPHAQNWVLHCKKFCEASGVEFFENQIQINLLSGESLEQIARAKRYEVFSKYLSPNDLLLTAHHQDDQAETFLLQLVRGAGVKGLSAMPAIKNFAEGFHARPLLNFSRNELQEYAELHGLKWIEDESNSNSDFSRNFIRQEVMPLLQSRWPSVSQTISRSADHCAKMQHWFEENFSLENFSEDTGITLSLKKLLQENAQMQNQILRQWILHHQFPLPSALKLQHVITDVLHAGEDKTPCVSWENVELRRYRDQLFLMPKKILRDLPEKLIWNFHEPLFIPGLGKLIAKPVFGKGLREDIKEVTIAFRQGGEKFKLPGRDIHHDLKKLFQEWNVPPWQRDEIPLVYVENQLAAVVPFALDESFKADQNQQGREIVFEK